MARDSYDQIVNNQMVVFSGMVVGSRKTERAARLDVQEARLATRNIGRAEVVDAYGDVVQKQANNHGVRDRPRPWPARSPRPARPASPRVHLAAAASGRCTCIARERDEPMEPNTFILSANSQKTTRTALLVHLAQTQGGV
jgi:hypothetical protein